MRSVKRDERRRCVALDMDGVVIDGMSFHVEAWRRAFARHGVIVSPMEIFLLEGVETSKVVDSLCLDKGISLSASERLDIVDSKRRTYREIFRVAPLPGSVDLVQMLASYGYGLALVTGTTRESAERALGELEIRNCFSCIISSESVRNSKPLPEPYCQALTGLKADPERCVAVENSPPGVTSAKSAGMGCIAVATYIPPVHLLQADRVFANVQEAATWFEAEFVRSGGQGTWHVR